MSKHSKDCPCKKLYPDWVRVSPSQIKTWRDCNQKWGYNKINGIEGEQSAGAAFGEEMHGHGEDWMRFRIAPPKTPAGKAFSQGIGKKDFLPKPRTTLLVEHHFVIELPELHKVLLHGYIDLMVPDDVPEVIDYKYTKSRKWIPAVEELEKDPQPLIYAAAGLLHFGVRRVKTRWLYFITNADRTKPKGTTKRELEWEPDTPALVVGWDRIVHDSAAIAHARRTVKKAEDLTPNFSACQKYGGCEFGPDTYGQGHLDICPREGSKATAWIRQDDRFKADKETLTKLNTGEK